MIFGHRILYKFDCNLKPRKSQLFCEKINKTLLLSPPQQIHKSLFLIAAEDHTLPRRCFLGFIKCEIVDEEGNKAQQTEIIFEPMKKFEDKSHFIKARPLSGMVDFVVWYIRRKESLQKCENRICGIYRKKFQEYNKITLALIQNIEMNLIRRIM